MYIGPDEYYKTIDQALTDLTKICDNVTVHSFSRPGSPYINYICMYIGYKHLGNGQYHFRLILDNRTYSTSYYNPEIYVELRFTTNSQMITDNNTMLFKANDEKAGTNWIIGKDYYVTYTGNTAPKLDVRVYHTRTSDYYFDTGWNAYPTNGNLDFLTPPVITGITLTSSGYHSITINWTADKNCSKISYIINDGSGWSSWNDVSLSSEASSGSYKINNLDFYHNYYIIIKGYNSAGWSVAESAMKNTKTWGAFFYYKDNTTWKKCLVWYKDGNTWKKAIPYFKVGDAWKVSIKK